MEIDRLEREKKIQKKNRINNRFVQVNIKLQNIQEKEDVFFLVEEIKSINIIMRNMIYDKTYLLS